MTWLRDMIRVEAGILVAGFAVVIVCQVMRSVLTHESRIAFRRFCGGGLAGVVSIQLLAASLVFALCYLGSVLKTSERGALPSVPGYALALLAASQTLFVCVAVWRKVRSFGNLKNEGET